MPVIKGNSFIPHTMDSILEEDYDKEHSGKIRRIKMDNGNIVYIECEDPYGFWKISLEKGQLPERLKGSYTLFDQALRDVNLWLRDKPEPYIPSKSLTKKDNVKAVLETKEV